MMLLCPILRYPTSVFTQTGFFAKCEYLAPYAFGLFLLPLGRPRPRRTGSVPSAGRAESDEWLVVVRRGRPGPRVLPGPWTTALSKSGTRTSRRRQFMNHTVLPHARMPRIAGTHAPCSQDWRHDLPHTVGVGRQPVAVGL